MSWCQSFLDQSGQFAEGRVALAKACRPQRILYVEGYLDQWVSSEALALVENPWEPSTLVTMSCGKDRVLAEVSSSSRAVGMVDADLEPRPTVGLDASPRVLELVPGSRADLNAVLLLDIIDIERRGLVPSATMENLRRTLTTVGVLRRQALDYRDRHGDSPLRGLSSPPFSLWKERVGKDLVFDRSGFQNRCRRAMGSCPMRRRFVDDIFARAEGVEASIPEGSWEMVRGHDLGELLFGLASVHASCASDTRLWTLIRRHVVDGFHRGAGGKEFVRRLSSLLSRVDTDAPRESRAPA
jgi:hypothetical protein